MMPVHSVAEPVTIHLPPADRAELEELARASSRDAASLAAEAVRAYLETRRWQTEVIRGRMQTAERELATDEEVDAAYAAFR